MVNHKEILPSSRTKTNSNLHRGDTLIEVLLSLALFSAIVVITINTMNQGIAKAESSLELTLVRSEIDAQAEAIRFIHNSFLNDRERLITSNDQSGEGSDSQTFLPIWRYLKGLAIRANEAIDAPEHEYDGCGGLFVTNSQVKNSIYHVGVPTGSQTGKVFIMNTRKITIKDPGVDPSDNYKNTILVATLDDTGDKPNASKLFKEAVVNPRIIYNSPTTNSDDRLEESNTTVSSVEGLWVQMVEGDEQGTKASSFVAGIDTPGYYDFHINACWKAPGQTVSTTVGTIVRLYNPEYMEEN